MKHITLLTFFLMITVSGFGHILINNVPAAESNASENVIPIDVDATNGINGIKTTWTNSFFRLKSTEIFSESFDAATSVDGWTQAGDAAGKPAEVTFEHAATAGVGSTGAMRYGGTNADGVGGRAYIVEKVFTGIDFGGATDVIVSVSIKSEGLVGTNLAALTDIGGNIVNKGSLNPELSESDFVTYMFEHTGISGSANSVKIQFNVAAGAVQGHGGTILIDDLKVMPVGGGGGGPEPGAELVTNGDFEGASTDPWFVNFGDGTVPVQEDGGNKFLLVDVETAGDAFAVNLSQVLSITQGETYTLTFDASSSGNGRTMLAGIGLNEAPFTSATETVNLTSSSQTFTFDLTATAFGIPNSRVLFDMGADTGIVVIDNVSLKLKEGNGGGGGEVPLPATAAPTPPERNVEDVISLFSNAYTNVAVTTWSTDWSEGSTNSDLKVGEDDVKLFKMVNFSGIQLENSIDLSTFTHMHIDYWVADAVVGGEVFNPKLSNHDKPGGEVGESSAVILTNPVSASQEWVSLDVPLADFTIAGGGTDARNKINQIILATDGTIENIYIDNFYFYKGMPVSIEEPTENPNRFALEQNYPNPFNPTTNIAFSLPQSGLVTLDVFSIQGQKVATLVNGFKSSGSHSVTFDAANLASGVYIYRLTSGNTNIVKKMMLIK